MASRISVLGIACLIVACGSSTTPNPNVPSSETSSMGSSKKNPEDSEVAQWSEVPQNEPASQRSVIGKRKSQVLVVSNPEKHGDALHFQFMVNNVALSGVFSAPGGQTSTFTLPTGSVQVTNDECKGDPQYFELAPGEKVTLNCELTTDGDCCDVATADDEKQ